MPFVCIFLLCGMLLPGVRASGQDSEFQDVQLHGRRYLEISLSRMQRFEKQQKRRQEKLLARLMRKERRLKVSLPGSDSAAWERYDAQGLSLDSIAALAKADTSAVMSRFVKRSNARLDSLRGVTRFLDQASARAGAAGDLGGYGSRIDALQGRLEYRKYIDEQIARRTAGLTNFKGGGIPAVTGMQKELYYARAQVKTCQALADDPGRLEEKAYEFLQGQAGFEESVEAAVNGGNPLSAAGGTSMSAAQLERMGYQTRRQVGAALEQKLGGNAAAVQQQLGAQIGEWKEKTAGAAAQLKDLRQSVSGIRKPGAPDFKINPMRCLPFWQRIETSYDFQTTRPTVDGRPAMLQLGGMAAYRQSPKLKAGVGIAGSLGLGQGWSQIRLSFEGIGLRTFASWELKWGVAAYAGYERMYRQAALFAGNEATPAVSSPHSTRYFSESALLGLTKSYKISARQAGAIQVLYDLWWADKGLQSPFILRYSTGLN